MIQIILIDINGNIIEKKVKNLNSENIYKKCGLSNNNNFICINNYFINNDKIQVWSKIKGKINIINNYKLPSNLNNNIYYGKILFLKLNNKNEYINIKKTDIEYIQNKYINEDKKKNIGVNKCNKNKFNNSLCNQNNNYDKDICEDVYSDEYNSEDIENTINDEEEDEVEDEEDDVEDDVEYEEDDVEDEVEYEEDEVEDEEHDVEDEEINNYVKKKIFNEKKKNVEELYSDIDSLGSELEEENYII